MATTTVTAADAAATPQPSSTHPAPPPVGGEATDANTVADVEAAGCVPISEPNANATTKPPAQIVSSTASTSVAEAEKVEFESKQLVVATSNNNAPLSNKKLLLCRRFKDCGGILRNFNSLPLFVYATSSSTHATSADGVGVSKEAAAAASTTNNCKNDSYDLALCTSNSSGVGAVIGAMDCLAVSGGAAGLHHHAMVSSSSGGVSGLPTATVISVSSAGGLSGVSYQQQLNLNHHQHLLSQHSPYSNNYPLHHSSSHHHIHSDQTKSLQELQHEVGALLEFRDLVIETFPDLKYKMASMSSSASTAVVGNSSVAASVSTTNTLTGGISSSSLASRREWEPGIRIKRKSSQKEPSTSATAATATAGAAAAAATAGELSSSSLTRSRSNSHSGKKEPKSGENHNGSVVQDSGFSTETSSSKDGHSASSTNGAITGANASNRLSCPESDDELLNLLDVIHRKSSRLREEMDNLLSYERENLRGTKHNSDELPAGAVGEGANTALIKSNSSSTISGLTPKTFREHVERLNKEDIKQLRKERDRLLDKLAEMEAETLTGRIKAAKMSDQVEELISVKKDLEEQLKLAMAQKLELSSRVQQMQLQQQQQLQSKSSSSQSDYSSQHNFLSSATTVLSTGGSGASHVDSANATAATVPAPTRRPNTFQPVVIEQRQQQPRHLNAFHQSTSSDTNSSSKQLALQGPLGRLDGVVSTPGGRNSKCRVTDSKRFTAILLETSVIELQRHLLTLTVQNQALMQKLEQSTKSKSHLAKRLDKSKEDVDDLRFQLEEKNIELEGTKAQLRVLESRIHSVTPTTTTNSSSSYMHSQNDYETNRSSASTTLMLSRRGGGGSGIDSHCSELRSCSPNSHMPPPTTTQISTPSMKAMVHLPMDELQQHSSSTESAHEHEQQQSDAQQRQTATSVSRLMSTSVGGVSPFEQQPRGHQLALKKFVSGTASKPSKIPLPGSKTASYFANKPPTGRPSTAGRSPPSASAHTSTGSNASSKSSLSRSTGNLLYSKSPNSLKRGDSAQSIHKDANNCSLSTNTSRSSNSSSIPLATTPYGVGSRVTNSPSPRVLQNSPLPKLKRESLTSRMRHMDSLSRMHHHQQQQQQHLSNVSSTTSEPSFNTTPLTPVNSSNSYLISSTPKPSAIAAQFNSALRKDLQLGSSSFSQGSQPFLRRNAGGGGAVSPSTSSSANSTRRFSSASVLGARSASRNQQQESAADHHSNGSNGNAPSDSDSGKNLALLSARNSKFERGNANKLEQAPRSEPTVSHNANNDNVSLKQLLNMAPQGAAVAVCTEQPMMSVCQGKSYTSTVNSSTSQHTNKNPLLNKNIRRGNLEVLVYEDADAYESQSVEDYFSQEAQLFSLRVDSSLSSHEGSDNLLVTIDYGYADSIESQLSGSCSEQTSAGNATRGVYTIQEEAEEECEQQKAHDEQRQPEIWFYTPQQQTAFEREQVAAAFKVHHMQHSSFVSTCSLLEYDVDEQHDEQIDSSAAYGLCKQTEMERYCYDYDDDDEDGEQFSDSMGYI